MVDSRLIVWLRRNGKWKHWTPYYSASLLCVSNTAYGTVYTRHGQDYLLHEGDVSRIPYYVSLELQETHRLTQQWGPYKFFNGFETTEEAEYLKKMFQYPELTDRAQKKVTDILFEYSIWIEIDNEFMNVLKERERRIADAIIQNTSRN